jgi:hypothetical protein
MDHFLEEDAVSGAGDELYPKRNKPEGKRVVVKSTVAVIDPLGRQAKPQRRESRSQVTKKVELKTRVVV